MIAIVDYGMGNLGSIRNMLKKIGYDSQITGDPGALREAEQLILPGVGAFDEGMRRLGKTKLDELLTTLVHDKRVPVLGICLGMQLLCRSSEEGLSSGLGWLAADAIRIPRQDGLKLPHMGWNFVESEGLDMALPDPCRFYFVHSYYVREDRPSDVVFRTRYGAFEFASGVSVGNVSGVQFHPEKSHKFGAVFLAEYLSRKGNLRNA